MTVGVPYQNLDLPRHCNREELSAYLQDRVIHW